MKTKRKQTKYNRLKVFIFWRRPSEFQPDTYVYHKLLPRYVSLVLLATNSRFRRNPAIYTMDF